MTTVTKTLAELKAGDWITSNSAYGKAHIVQIVKVTEKLFRLGMTKYSRKVSRKTGVKLGDRRVCYRPATDEEIATNLAKKEAERQAQLVCEDRETWADYRIDRQEAERQTKVAREQREPQEDYRLATQFSSTDRNEWLTLSVERLRMIAQWLAKYGSA